MANNKFSFGGIQTTTPKKHLNKKRVDISMYRSPTYNHLAPHLLFITEVPVLNKAKIKSLCIYITKNTSLPFLIVSATTMLVSIEVVKKDGISEFYRSNSSNFAEYINKNSIVVPLGHALLALTGDDNVYTTCFTDWLFNETRLYIKKHNCYAYPAFGIDNIIIRDKQNIYRPRHWSRTNFSSYQIKKATQEKMVLLSSPREPKIIKFSTEEEVTDFLLSHIGKEELLSWDLETAGFDFRKDRVGCITMSFDGRTGYYIPWRLINVPVLNEFFIGKKGIGSHIKFDLRMLRKYGITTAKLYCDTLNLGHIIDENRKNGMKSLAYHYTMFGGYDAELDEILRKTGITNYLDIPEVVLSEYATMDAIIGFQIYEAMQKQLDDIDRRFPNPHYPTWTLRRYFEEIVMPWVEESAEIELEGVYIDEKALAENSLFFQEKIGKLKKEIADSFLTTEDVISSPEKLGKMLKERGWENMGQAKKGHFLTNDVCLEGWKKQGHPEAALLQRMRTLDTLYSTFVGSAQEKNGWYAYLHDGKVNPEYQAMLAGSHRNKCRNPNFQNIACHDAESKHITRNIATPGPNFKFSTLDYKALQIKLCTIESKDPVLLDIYKNNRSGGDLHSITGYNIFCAGKEFPVPFLSLTLEDGSIIEIPEHRKISVIREGQTLTIKGSDIKEGDDIDESSTL